MKLNTLPTLNVSLSDNLNNWQVLPWSYEENFEQGRFRITTQRIEGTARYLNGSVVDGAFDTHIDYAVHSHYFPYMDPRNMLVLERWDKVQQAVSLKQWSTAGKTKYMKNIATSMLRARAGKYNSFDLPTVYPKGRFLIRPAMGARGIGQMIVNTNVIPMLDALNLINKPEFLEKAPPEGISFFKGDQNHDGEGDQYLKSGDFFIQEVVSVMSEFRVIKGKKNIELVMSRPRGKCTYSGEYEAATKEKDQLVYIYREGQVLDDSIHALSGAMETETLMPDQHYRTVREALGFIAKFLPDYNSVDLFFTSDYRWGIFEFCNQFSCNDIPMHEVQQMTRRWLKQELQARLNAQ